MKYWLLWDSEKSNITVLNCQFERNAGSYGGAIAAWNQSNLTVIGNRFDGNVSEYSGGTIS